MRSMFAGVSGLKAHQTRMDVIGNNISNINTIGFKSSRVTFSDMLSQTSSSASAPTSNSGGINAKQIGLGAAVSSIDMIFTDGSAQSTGKNTDITLSGNGLFVLKKGGDSYYSRDGAFEFDTNGNYVLPGSGYYVQGWNAVNGTLNTDSATENIVVKTGKTMEGTATTSVDYTGNLNSAAPTITNISYTTGGGTADPSMVIESKKVTGISVSSAYNCTYDPRVMVTTTGEGDAATSTPSLVLTAQYVDENSETQTVTINSENAATYFGDTGFESGKIYSTSGNNSKFTVGEGDAAVDYTITKVSYSVSNTITTQEGDSSAVLTLSNGVTIPVTELAAGTQYTIGTKLSDMEGIYNAETMSGYSDATLTGVSITSTTTAEDGTTSSTTTSYPTAVSSNASKSGSIKAYFDDGTVESISSGTYSVGQEVLNSVNVDGTNVIAATLTLSDGTTQKVTSGYYERNHSIPISTVITIYDSIGNSHAVSVLIDKDASSTDSNMTADALDLARITDDDGNIIEYTSIAQNTNADGTVTYSYTSLSGETGTATSDQVAWDSRWRVYLAPSAGTSGATTSFSQTEEDNSLMRGYLNSTTDENGNPVGGAFSYIYFNDDGSYSASANQEASLYATYSNGNGATAGTSSISFADTTQYAGSTTVYGVSDGNAYGILQSVQIDASGVITGTYTNGILRNEAQIAIAQFVNTAGLTKVGTSLYQASNNSGDANIKTVDAFGLTITPSSLEMSNVELASELADMIVTQRGFQSNSKIITVADEMLETIVNMKR